MRTAGNAIFKMGSCIERYVSFREAAVVSKGIARKKSFVKPHCIKSGIAEKNFRIN